jgi:hypothetical protein
MEDKRKHLEMIQEVIARMSGNLFYLKGWTVTLVAGLFAFAVKGTNDKSIFVTFFPILIFWILDGYFLSQERCYRALYDDVRQLKEDEIDFTMDASTYKKFTRNTWPSAMFSYSLIVFYGLLVLYLLGLTYLARQGAFSTVLQ